MMSNITDAKAAVLPFRDPTCEYRLQLFLTERLAYVVIHTSGETFVLVGLPPGPHKVLFELADPTHRTIPGTSQTVTFTVP